MPWTQQERREIIFGRKIMDAILEYRRGGWFQSERGGAGPPYR